MKKELDSRRVKTKHQFTNKYLRRFITTRNTQVCTKDIKYVKRKSIAYTYEHYIAIVVTETIKPKYTSGELEDLEISRLLYIWISYM